jgi:hypothetical protein
MLSSEYELVVSVILSSARVAVTPAAEALIRAMTLFTVSFALTAMLVPLIVNAPAVTCAPFSNLGRRMGFVLLNVALPSISIGVWLTVVDAVWSLVYRPEENSIESPISSPR